MAKYHNIELREHETRRYSVGRAQDAAYAEATGEKEVLTFTGLWDEVLEKAEAEVESGGGKWAVTCECERQGGGMGQMLVTRTAYRAAAGDAELGTAENPIFTESYTVQPEPLLMHPRYFSTVNNADAELLRELEQGTPLLSDVVYGGKACKLRVALGKLSGMAAEVRDYYMRGVTEYYEIYGDVTAKWKGEARHYDVGEICTPPGSPNTPDGREWLCVGVGKEKNGEEVWYTASFRLSGRGGWDKKLYGGSSV